MDLRHQALRDWLRAECQAPELQLIPMTGDASFRRYFRVSIRGHSYIAMDAPPPQENCLPYIAIAQALRQLGLKTPEIIKSNLTQGFLLITDFGDHVLLKILNTHNAEQIYSNALDSLHTLQSCRQVANWTLPIFTAEFMRKELELFKEWFLQKHLRLDLSFAIQQDLNTAFVFLTTTATQQTQVFMHRDYHSANLMLLPNQQVGILDFQDALIGPVTYDLVSLLRDCYVAWPESLVDKLVYRYWDQINLPHVTADEFKRWFDLMGVQRHLKALLTFSRKFHRDNNANYLQHVPRTLNYVEKITARYSECSKLHEFIKNKVLPCAQ